MAVGPRAVGRTGAIGRELGRGPDNEPLVECVEPVAWVADEVVEAAVANIENTNETWGPLRRAPDRPEEGAAT